MTLLNGRTTFVEWGLRAGDIRDGKCLNEVLQKIKPHLMAPM
jgi:hypothetical protein